MKKNISGTVSEMACGFSESKCRKVLLTVKLKNNIQDNERELVST